MTQHPDYIVPTGDFIQEWMEDEEINAAELARRLGVTRKHVSELLHGKAPLSAGIALRLESVTGIPARIWNLHEAGYRGALAQQAAEQSLEDQYATATSFPLAYLRAQGFISAARKDKPAVVRQVLRFFGIASFDAFDATWAHGSVAYRRSAVNRQDHKKLSTWLRAAEVASESQDLAPYNRPSLEALLPGLRALTCADPAEGIQRAQALLADAGVSLVLTPRIEGLGIYGATRWYEGHPLVQLSGLRQTDDQLWFTLFHELGHVLLHDRRGLYLADDDNNMEQEANAFARDILIPPEKQNLIPESRNLDAVKALADDLGIAPSIVLGQAQHRSHDYAWGHQLKRPVNL